MNLNYRNCLILILAALLQSCGGGREDHSQEPTPRQGLDLAISSGSGDFNPAISADGKSIVFISTRDGGSRRIYKVSSDIGSTTDISPTLLMSEGVLSKGVRLQETDVWISPDGKYVFFQTYEAGVGNSSQLYRVDFATGKDISAPILKQGAVSSLVFSQETPATYFAFTNLAEGASTVKWATIADPATQTSIQNSTVLFFLANSTDLITYSNPKGALSFQQTTLPSKTSSVWGAALTSSKLLLGGTKTFSLSQKGAYFIQDITSSQSTVSINGNSEKKIKQNITNVLLPADTKGVPGQSINPTDSNSSSASKLLSLSFSGSDQIGVYVGLETHLCQNQNPVSGTTLVLLTGSDNLKQILPSFNDSSWTAFTGGICAAPNQVDIRILGAFINSGATQKNYRIVYSSMFQNAKLTTNPKSRIFVLDSADGTTQTLRQIF